MTQVKQGIVDVAIVGASIAGASLALRLAKAGISSLLFDKANFPRFKPCGDGLSRAAIRELQSLEIREEQIAAHGIPFNGFIVVDNGKQFKLPFSTPGCSAGIAIRRSELDSLLHQALKDAPLVMQHLESSVTDVEENETKVFIKTKQETFEAKYLVWAGGVNKKLFNYSTPFEARYGYTVIFEGGAADPDNGVTIITKAGYELYLTRVAGNLLNASVLGSAQVFKEKSPEIWKDELAEAARKYLNFNAKNILEAAGSGPFGTHQQQNDHKRILCIGDASLCLDPISGMGMSHALISARYAAEALISHASISSDELSKKFNKRSNKLAKKLIGFTRLIMLAVQGGLQYRSLQFLTNTSMPLAMKDQAFSEKTHALGVALSVIGR